MTLLRFFLFGLLLLLCAIPAPAAHITDKLLAGFYDKPASTGQPIQVLPSGTPVEVLKQKGEFSQVRLSDHSEGWIESRYITDEKPAQVMLLELQARTSDLQQKLHAAKEGLHRAQQQFKETAQANKPHQGTAADVKQHASAQPEPTSTPQTFDPKAYLLWYLLGGGICALIGFVCGIAFFNYRFRKRFAGMQL